MTGHEAFTDATAEQVMLTDFLKVGRRLDRRAMRTRRFRRTLQKYKRSDTKSEE
jgi:hypothetical protein